jgi:acyl-CoA thioester hydrolase
MKPFVHTWRVRVRYAETDQMHVAWHGSYLLYFEEARTEALRASGWTYRSLEETGVLLPVVEAHIDFARPARYDDLLAVQTTVFPPAGARMRFEYRVRDESGADVVSGHTVLAFLNAATRRPCRPPAEMRKIFEG